MFIIKLLSQHVSDIIIPIIRRIRPCPTACGVSAWVYRLWLAVVLWRCVVSRVHCVKVTVTFTQCTLLTTQLHKTTANHSQPQSTTAYTPRQNTACSITRSYSPDDGHNDARNMLRWKFDNKYRISCILLVSLSSPYVHDARSQKPKKKSHLVGQLSNSILYLFFCLPGSISLSINSLVIQSSAVYRKFVCNYFPLIFNGLLLVFKGRQ